MAAVLIELDNVLLNKLTQFAIEDNSTLDDVIGSFLSRVFDRDFKIDAVDTVLHALLVAASGKKKGTRFNLQTLRDSAPGVDGLTPNQRKSLGHRFRFFLEELNIAKRVENENGPLSVYERI